MDKFILGPFLGHVTDVSIKIWLFSKKHKTLWVEVLKDNIKIEVKNDENILNFQEKKCFADVVEVRGLEANTKYSYRIIDENDNSIDLEGLVDEDLFFRTLPSNLEKEESSRLDFLLMSCHNPDKVAHSRDNSDGYEVWKTIPNILNENSENVRFAILGGDQVYADDWKSELDKASTIQEKQKIYLKVYRNYWSNIVYRKVLCSLPSYLMWDDHDIMDGWGSDEQFFNKEKTSLTPEAESMFGAAKNCFSNMQAIRNPEGTFEGESFDSCFRVGGNGFILADLRSHRDAFKFGEHGQIWTPDQFDRIKEWVAQNKENLDCLFFLTPVVMAHGDPVTEEGLVQYWDVLLNIMKKSNIIPSFYKYLTYLLIFTSIGLGFHYIFKTTLIALVTLPLIIYIFRKVIQNFIHEIPGKMRNSTESNRPYRFLRYFIALIIPISIVKTFMKNAGDLRDDINDGWGSKVNSKNAEELLDYLFKIQNEENVNVVVLSGDIHAGGYANIYSEDENHKEHAVIPHIVSSPVGYTPFPWLGEAFFRSKTKTINLGTSKKFSAQVSHHFTDRNVVVCSIRNSRQENKSILKVKYYVEGYKEPQIMIFDLVNSSHKEKIKW
jgi:phosphodiesterase/alkaline phosphatase D-like protein